MGQPWRSTARQLLDIVKLMNGGDDRYCINLGIHGLQYDEGGKVEWVVCLTDEEGFEGFWLLISYACLDTMHGNIAMRESSIEEKIEGYVKPALRAMENASPEYTHASSNAIICSQTLREREHTPNVIHRQFARRRIHTPGEPLRVFAPYPQHKSAAPPGKPLLRRSQSWCSTIRRVPGAGAVEWDGIVRREEKQARQEGITLTNRRYVVKYSE
ncbi:hypothetical protein CYLTODRAFT_446089 [Cylindrobasidium torrendii FP15055 ss-10]|uniref:Uncharacterized protein n=1 Tax=Cylindrobasidium torrendii FP15055 ss-10 TaxID=1314674 RepID=A0A0D7B286_9AGAR|nr:hypothetical protein CYLTODRAFT_446089 [Cylindrobasidium torrendii FP15055 ss-10]